MTNMVNKNNSDGCRYASAVAEQGEIDRAVDAERYRCWIVVREALTEEGWLGRSWQRIEKGILNG